MHISKDSTPSVSIVIPTLNGERLLGSQLESLVAQVEAPPFEVLIAEQRLGRRHAIALAQSFDDRLDLRIVDASAHRGQAYARNVGAASAKQHCCCFWTRMTKSCLSMFRRWRDAQRLDARRRPSRHPLDQPVVGTPTSTSGSGRRPCVGRAVPMGIRRHPRYPCRPDVVPRRLRFPSEWRRRGRGSVLACRNPRPQVLVRARRSVALPTAGNGDGPLSARPSLRRRSGATRSCVPRIRLRANGDADEWHPRHEVRSAPAGCEGTGPWSLDLPDRSPSWRSRSDGPEGAQPCSPNGSVNSNHRYTWRRGALAPAGALSFNG